MRNIFKKELKLSAHILSYCFILFGLMFFLPGYPILCGAFFVTLGIYQSFQSTRENNDILFSALLPFAKKDVVKGKYIFVLFVELCSILLMSVVTILRMTVFKDSEVYLNNALMNANPYALGLAFVIFGIFNSVFLGGFFKTAYKHGKPFIVHIVLTFVVIFIGEALHFIPGLSFFNSFGFENLGIQLSLLLSGILIFIVTTVVSCNISQERFEKIDL